ncbi:MAG: RDD family protein [Acidimicrobiales bacterium]
MTAAVAAGRSIVTPQGVVLDLEAAGVGYRGFGRVLDLLLLIVVGAAVLPIMSFLLGGTAGRVLQLLVIFVVIFGYPLVAETWWRGRTLGKAALGLRVVTVEAAPIGFREAAIRSMFQLIDIGSFGIIALLAGVVTDRSQRLGDVAAGTFVIRDPKSLAHIPAVPFTPPMGFEPLVSELDVSKLRPEQERLVRSFLLRVGELTRAARLELGTNIADATASRLGHDRRPFGDAETYLAAVMAARQLREGDLAELAIGVPPRKRRRFRR